MLPTAGGCGMEQIERTGKRAAREFDPEASDENHDEAATSGKFTDALNGEHEGSALASTPPAVQEYVTAPSGRSTKLS
jgi:hypothetical protein